jgi:NNP family nitrate/nitrite transporter-like MFS transporter
MKSTYHWYVLILATLTNTFGVAAQSMCLPVLFKEISTELNLSLVQVGLIWGISSLPGIFTVMIGGAIGDRFGPKRVLTLGCLLVGIVGALRGLSTDFYSLAGAMFFFGLFMPMISMNTLKTVGVWFSGERLGLASGFLSMGMALGFLTGSLISATWLSPWLGGWRNVLFLYGGLAMALTIPWFFTRSAPSTSHQVAAGTPRKSMLQTMRHVARIRNVWLHGIAILGVSGGIQGTLGYLPLYLRNLGWQPVAADGALATFHTISMLFTIPIALGSDRLGSRKKVLLASVTLILFGTGLLSVAQGALVWAAVCVAGIVRDGFMAVFMTSIIESEGVGAEYAGTAAGMAMVFSGFGNLFSPALGNSLESISPGLPFAFWAGMLLLAYVGIGLAKEKGKSHHDLSAFVRPSPEA